MRPSLRLAAVLLAAVAPAAVGRGAATVVVNEIFYHAPGDRDDVQWVELHNSAGTPVDVSGWTLDGGKIFTFPPGTTIPVDGYLVAALDPAAFAKAYPGGRAIGPFRRPLKRGGERLELRDGARNSVDVVRYKDRDPWPVAADGYAASLERVCPAAGADGPENWAASPLPPGPARPAGTPGKANAAHAVVLPPVVRVVGRPTADQPPDQPLSVEAEVAGGDPASEVTLLYRAFAGDAPAAEAAVPMAADAGTGRYRAAIPGQKAGTLLRYRVRAVGRSGAARYAPGENDLRPALSAYVHDAWGPAAVPLAFVLRPPADGPTAGAGRRPPAAPRTGFRLPFFGGQQQPPPSEARPARGTAALVWADPATGATAVFDFVTAAPRKQGRGLKVTFHKDRRLDGMGAVSLVYEGSDLFLLHELLAYDVYRLAGCPAPRAELVRLSDGGRPGSPHLLIERPNKAFLRRNQIGDAGDLFKILWFGDGVAGQHQPKTHAHAPAPHKDLLALIGGLNRARGDGQWELIRREFDVPEVATYFAVNAALSHWDGFFNNHFVYHDVGGTGKWMLFPWDQDKTWGFHDGLRGDDDVFTDMPLTFGMAGDRPPPGDGSPFGRGPAWWRPPGYFSGPLLANPEFRKVYLARLREVLGTVYTPAVFDPLIDAAAGRLREELQRAAAARGEDPGAVARQVAGYVGRLKTHLAKRRAFLLRELEAAK